MKNRPRDTQRSGNGILLLHAVEVEADQFDQRVVSPPLVHEFDHPVALRVRKAPITRSLRSHKGPIDFVEIKEIVAPPSLRELTRCFIFPGHPFDTYRRRFGQPVGNSISSLAQGDGVGVLVP